MKHPSLLGWSFLAVAALLLATVWTLPATASPLTDPPTPSPTPLPTPDLNVTAGQVLNFWLMLIIGGVLLAVLAVGSGLLSILILGRSANRQDRRDRQRKD